VRAGLNPRKLRISGDRLITPFSFAVSISGSAARHMSNCAIAASASNRMVCPNGAGVRPKARTGPASGGGTMVRAKSCPSESVQSTHLVMQKFFDVAKALQGSP